MIAALVIIACVIEYGDSAPLQFQQQLPLPLQQQLLPYAQQQPLYQPLQQMHHQQQQMIPFKITLSPGNSHYFQVPLSSPYQFNQPFTSDSQLYGADDQLLRQSGIIQKIPFFPIELNVPDIIKAIISGLQKIFGPNFGSNFFGVPVNPNPDSSDAMMSGGQMMASGVQPLMSGGQPMMMPSGQQQPMMMPINTMDPQQSAMMMMQQPQQRVVAANVHVMPVPIMVMVPQPQQHRQQTKIGVQSDENEKKSLDS